MRSTSDLCEDYAEQCAIRAADIRRYDLRLLYLDLAVQWRELAKTTRWLEQHRAITGSGPAATGLPDEQSD